MFLVDSHCHLNQLNYINVHKNIDDVLKKAADNHVKFMLSVSTTISEYIDMVKIIGQKSQVAYSCGLHPLYVNKYDLNICCQQLRSIVKNNNKVIALGETGLDYHYQFFNKEKQQSFFREHIKIACDLDKPLIVHTRCAKQDTLNILYSENAKICRGVLHCFTEDIIMAKKLLDIGFYISFSGIVTFKNVIHLHEIVRYIPLDRILLETDSPYLAPVPYRGKENHPALLYQIAKVIANLKNLSIEELAIITTNNFSRLFRIPLLIK
ncbi:MAG: YchF/TatD family DNA exonuclease [Candidatus Dasytiphilus stammeri]